MTFYTAAEFAQRQKQMQRQQTVAWMRSLAEQAGLSSSQAADTSYLDKLLLPAQASVDWTLDEPGGDRLHLRVYPNGSLVLQNAFEFAEQLDEGDLGEIIARLSERISDLFHEDVLQHSHALVRQETGPFTLRSIAQINTAASLAQMASESLVLKELLMEMLHALLCGSDDAC